MFIQIPHEYLKSISTSSEHTPTLYFHSNRLVRNFFWKRLRIAHSLARQYVSRPDDCLDFGCGNGVLLPTIAGDFRRVVGIDLELREARLVRDKYVLTNVELVEADIRTAMLGANRFSAVFALDVLEHFKELEPAVKKLRDWLALDGYLFTSLPTENFFTIASRKLSGTKKPVDHYHTAAQVEAVLRTQGFVCVKHRVFSRLFPLYYISVWQKSPQRSCDHRALRGCAG